MWQLRNCDICATYSVRYNLFRIGHFSCPGDRRFFCVLRDDPYPAEHNSAFDPVLLTKRLHLPNRDTPFISCFLCRYISVHAYALRMLELRNQLPLFQLFFCIGYSDSQPFLYFISSSGIADFLSNCRDASRPLVA